ncbi:unnamed protein product [Chironomus riparius]|uniref:Uncharacterized protein n=1 Tax=Chironomus riparius TaxID=315576 RepID=A0A9N9WM97_9DIPT|nr:unnamed protein product [Chironomus riparius]
MTRICKKFNKLQTVRRNLVVSSTVPTSFHTTGKPRILPIYVEEKRFTRLERTGISANDSSKLSKKFGTWC